VLGLPGPAGLDERLAPVLGARETSGRPLMVFCHYYPSPEAVDRLAEDGIAWFTSQAGAGHAVAALALRGAAKGRHRDRETAADPRLQLTAADCEYEIAVKTWLRDRGFPVPDATLVSSAQDAGAALERIGQAVAMKLHVPGLGHKSDIGGVVLGITTRQDAEATFVRLSALAPQPQAQVLVERMADPGRELLVGVLIDPDLGPFLMLGPGGVDAELGAGQVIWPAPVGPTDARAMIERLPIRPALGPWRRAPARDLEALAALLVQVSSIAEANAQSLSELELNPVIVHAQGSGLDIVDALAVPRLAAAEEEDARGL